MFISKVIIKNFRCFGEGEETFELTLNPGLTALVGENDSGKTAIIDALRFVFGTTDQEWYRLEDSDFHNGSTEISIVCKFDGLSEHEMRAFIEYLTFENERPVLFVNWTAQNTGETHKGRPYRRTEVHSGAKGEGPSITTEARELLRVTYLRPLRDAEQALSACRGSRLAQILLHTEEINHGAHHNPTLSLDGQSLSMLGICKLIEELLKKQEGVKASKTQINENLGKLALHGDRLESGIKVAGESASDSIKLRELLEKLDLGLNGPGKFGLGSNNLLFIACELLLLSQDDVGNKLLLIEEPEAHLHTQRQLRVMEYMQEKAAEKGIQVIATTHSPNLASAIDLENLVMIRGGHAFSMAASETKLDASDYRFLQRFLDSTKANLFFARGVMIVEGDAENILIPTLAKLIGRDFTEYGVSIVNVGGVGLRRYSRIFQRKNTDGRSLEIPVACITDIDVMPNCAPYIIEKIKEGDAWPSKSPRRWRAKRDYEGAELDRKRQGIDTKATGQYVKTFIADEWTLEYNIALGPRDENGKYSTGLNEDVYIAICLAEKDNEINDKIIEKKVAEADARVQYTELKARSVAAHECTVEEVLASQVYAKLVNGNISKTIVAQYLAERLFEKYGTEDPSTPPLEHMLPQYLVDAIHYATGSITARLGGGAVDNE